MSTNLEKLLAEVRELDGKAIKGPWAVEADHEYTVYAPGDRYVGKDGAPGCFGIVAENIYPKEIADLIARYRTLAPKLAEIVALYESTLEFALDSIPADQTVACDVVEQAWLMAEQIAGRQ